MSDFIHKSLADGRWKQLTFPEQMANIGSEVNRAIQWKKKNNPVFRENAIKRALELLYLTIEAQRKRKGLRELTRLREVLLDYFYCDNIYHTTDEFLEKYFLDFNRIARKNK